MEPEREKRMRGGMDAWMDGKGEQGRTREPASQTDRQRCGLALPGTHSSSRQQSVSGGPPHLVCCSICQRGTRLGKDPVSSPSAEHRETAGPISCLQPPGHSRPSSSPQLTVFPPNGGSDPISGALGLASGR